jgi:hypothetical protein
MYHVNLVQEPKANNLEPINYNNKVLFAKVNERKTTRLSQRPCRVAGGLGVDVAAAASGLRRLLTGRDKCSVNSLP